jgi:hypothetical protein
MSNPYARILAAGGAMVLAVTLSVPAALAAGTWTVQPGGGVQATSGLVNIRDTTTGTLLTCVRSAASGTVKSGSGLPGSHAGSLSAVRFPICNAGPVPMTVQAGGLPWHVNLSSYNAATGVVTGAISHLQITETANGCSFAVDGTSGTAGDGWVPFTYTDSTGQLTVLATGGNLHTWNVSAGCLGLVNTGDRARLGGTFTVSPKQAITSP